jgi:twinkle protein
LADYTYEYLPWRTISKETMQVYDVKTRIKADGQPDVIGFRYPSGAIKGRYLDRKDFYWQKDKDGNIPAGLFGKDKFQPGASKYVTITEGEPDALSYYQVLQGPVVSVQSSSSALRDCTADRAWLNSYERIYFAFDNDEQGRHAFEECRKLFDYHKVYFVRFTTRKDANEYLSAGEGESLRRLWWNSGLYIPENIKSTFVDFREILDRPRKQGVSYPFKTLTEMTYGIRTGETVLVKAPEKVGKTELMHFFLHNVLKETDDNVGAIFLEEPAQRLLQALAGIELRQPVHLPECDLPSDQILAACKEVVRRDERLHVYSYFGSDDPVVFLDTIRFLATARNCRYIFVDHISILLSGNAASTDERRQLDWVSTRLEMLVKELDIALIIVSHVNDAGQTRGSRYMTKVFDLTIDVSRDLMNSDPLERNTIHLSIPYSRFPGITGPAGDLLFHRDTYSFEEIRGANDNEPPSKLQPPFEQVEVQRDEPSLRAA